MAATAADDTNGPSKWAGTLAKMYGTDPEKVRAAVAHLGDDLLRTWLNRAAVPFVARMKAEAERLGLPVAVVRGMLRLAEDRAEQNACLR